MTAPRSCCSHAKNSTWKLGFQRPLTGDVALADSSDARAADGLSLAAVVITTASRIVVFGWKTHLVSLVDSGLVLADALPAVDPSYAHSIQEWMVHVPIVCMID